MNSNYGEFMSQYFMDSFLGETTIPNKANPVSMRRHALRQQIAGNPRKALAVVQRNIPRLDKYIMSKGESPLDNVFEKSVQAYLLKSKEIADVSQTLGVSPDDAQTYLDDAESKGHEINHSDADSFIGDIIGAISQVAQPAIDKIAAKRAAAGKPAGIFGTLASGGTQAYNTIRGLTPDQLKNLASGGTINDPNATAQGTGLLAKVKMTGQNIIDKVGDAERKRQLNKMIPYFVGAVIVFLLIFLLAKKK